MPSLTLAEAERILQAAKAAATEMGVKLGISVVDPRGDLLCMVRMDGAPWRTPVISQGKAMASACFGKPSGELTDQSMTPVMRAMMHLEAGRFIPGKGALPVMRNGEIIGAIGCSGGSAQQDEDVAQAGLKGIGPRLVETKAPADLIVTPPSVASMPHPTPTPLAPAPPATHSP